MVLAQPFGKRIARALIGVLLFAQFAVAGHACARALAQVVAPGSDVMVLGANPDAMAHAVGALETEAAPPCHPVDGDATILCVEHCRYGQQNVGASVAASVAPGLAALLYTVRLEPLSAPVSGRVPAAPCMHRAAAPPPHAILHCVFRI